MPMNEQDARALTYLAMRIRADTTGAGPWDEHGTFTNVRKLANRNLAMTAEHIIRHAADPKAKSPGVLLGSFTPSAPVEVKRGNPHRGEPGECKRHPGQWVDNCGLCKFEDCGDEPTRPVPADGFHHTLDASLARAQLAAAKARVCGCGVRAETCPQHRPAATTEETP